MNGKIDWSNVPKTCLKKYSFKIYLMKTNTESIIFPLTFMEELEYVRYYFKFFIKFIYSSHQSYKLYFIIFTIFLEKKTEAQPCWISFPRLHSQSCRVLPTMPFWVIKWQSQKLYWVHLRMYSIYQNIRRLKSVVILWFQKFEYFLIYW